MREFQRPNVLLLYTDQQRADSLGCYGSTWAQSPHIDRLAADGVRFSNYYVQNPVCMPSRMSFLTGRYCSSLGIGTNGIPFPAERAAPVQSIFRANGYQTAQIGKLHFDPHARRNHRNPTPGYGFDTLILSDEPGCYDCAYTKWVEALAPEQLHRVRTSLAPEAERWKQPSYSKQPRGTEHPYLFEGSEELTHSSFVASETSRFLRQRRDTPFFAIAGFYAPHPPVNPPERFLKTVDVSRIPAPVLGPDERYAAHLAAFTPEDWKRIRQYYYALTAHVDDCVGQILHTLEQTGQADNTLIVFTTDHGEFAGDHGMVQKWMPGHDCIVRVPFIVRFPRRIPRGLSCDALAEGVDFVPTVLDYCGIQTPDFVQGHSLKSVLDAGGQAPSDWRDDVLTECFVPFGARMATVKTREFMYHHSTAGAELLFNRKDDPGECVNVAARPEYAPALSEMRRRMLHRLQRAQYNCTDIIAAY